MNNRIVLSIMLACLLQSPNTWASRYVKEGFYDSARVVRVETIVRQVRYQRAGDNCHWRGNHESEYRSYSGMIGGGLVGGIVGNQFGKGRGKKVMTIAGTLLGASVGNDLYLNGKGYRQAPERKKACNAGYKKFTKEAINGYLVTYRYKGKLFEQKMRRHPGRRIRVWVDVTPVG